MFAAGGAGNLSRQLTDNERLSLGVWIGRSVAAGVGGGGSVAYWVAYHGGGSSVSNWLYLFASFAIGYTFIDVRDSIIKALIRWICKKFGASEDKQN